MKRLFFLLALSFTATITFAQSRTATADYNKTMQPAVETEIPFDEKTVMKSLVEKMEQKGYKGKENKGYMVFKGVTMTELGSGTYDLYFKAERKSRKEKDITILTMLVSSGYEKFLGESDNATAIDGAKSFLNSHMDHATAYDLEQQIKSQEEVLAKANKKFNGLIEDSTDLVKKIEKLHKEQDEVREKTAAQKTEVEKQALILDTLKRKRKQ